jgi:hypothetical protein
MEERLTRTLRYVAELPRGNVEVAPDARPRTGPSRYTLLSRRWLASAGAIVVSACLAVGGLAVAGIVGQGAAGWELVGTVTPAWGELAGSVSLQVGLSLTCTSATTCFSSGPGPNGSPGALGGAVEMTSDGGHGWHQLALPGYAISGVQCRSPSTCAVLTVTGVEEDRNKILRLRL